MKKKNFIKIGKAVINLEIKALKKLKKDLNNSFNLAVEQIVKCKSKVILCGVGKSGLIANKIASTLSSVGTASFYLSASDSSHGDLGSISKKDILILISNSGETNELKNIIQYANRNKILLIGIVSKKDSVLYKSSNIKLLIPKVSEAGSIVPTSSTTSQLALGDALAIATMRQKKFNNKDFKKIHPAGSLGAQLKTVEDIMLVGKAIPFVNENLKMKDALKVLNSKKLGFVLVRDKKNLLKGIISDGDFRRFTQKKQNLHNLLVKQIMTKNPIGIDKNELAAKALSIMNNKKITSLCVFNKKNKYKTIGVLHIHNILQSNISWMQKSLILRISVIITILILLLLIILSLNQGNKELTEEKKETIKENIEKSNVLKDVEYNSKDSSGNVYILKASEGIIDQNNTNIIYLTSIKAIIELEGYNSIDISSNFGKYSIDNFDTIFSKNVIIKYLDNIIMGEYLEFSLNKNLMTISRNVILKNNKSSLKADVIEVDIKTKDIKISMYEENKKINIESTN